MITQNDEDGQVMLWEVEKDGLTEDDSERKSHLDSIKASGKQTYVMGV